MQLGGIPSSLASLISENFGPERAIKSYEKEDFMRIEGPMSARVKELWQLFPFVIATETKASAAILTPAQNPQINLRG